MVSQQPHTSCSLKTISRQLQEQKSWVQTLSKATFQLPFSAKRAAFLARPAAGTDTGMTEPKASRAGCSCTRVTAAIWPCLLLEAEGPSAKGLPSLLEKRQSPGQESQAVLEEELKASALRALEQSLLNQVTLERTRISQHQPKLASLGTSQIPHTYL